MRTRRRLKASTHTSLPHCCHSRTLVGSRSEKESCLIDACDDAWTEELCLFFDRDSDRSVVIAVDRLGLTQNIDGKNKPNIRKMHIFELLCVCL